ncbi:MAG: AMP-binding protein [Caulobacteraceae bacterium]
MSHSLWAQVHGDKVAIHDPIQTRTFRQINAAANKVVRLLRERGLKEGDRGRPAVQQPRRVRRGAGGCRRGGYRLTPVNWHLSVDEAEYIINDCDAKALFAETRYAGRDAVQGAAGDAEGLHRRRRDRLRALREAAGGVRRLGHHRPDARLADALHLRHHRAAEGRLCTPPASCWPTSPSPTTCSCAPAPPITRRRWLSTSHPRC